MEAQPQSSAHAVRRTVVHGSDPLSADDLSTVRSLRTPIITDDPDDAAHVRALFLCEHETDDPRSAVYLWVNRLTDKRHLGRGMMQSRGNGIWFVELTVPRDVLATYRFLPLSADGNEPEHVPSPRELLRRARVDHHNATASEGSPFGSILAGPDAPELDVWTAPASSSSTVLDRTVDLGRSPLRYRVVVPPGGGPLDLLVVFDADRWVDEYRLPDVLSAAGLRYAVLGVDSPADPGARLRFLGAHDELFAAVADDALPAVHRRIGGPHRVVVAGQSLGGLAALSFTARHTDLVDEVLAYSPSVWWRPGLVTRPADVTAHQEWIHDQIVACAPGAFTIRLASGAFEDELTPGVAGLATTALRAGHAVEHTVYSGGHDEAQWATILLAHLRNPS